MDASSVRDVNRGRRQSRRTPRRGAARPVPRGAGERDLPPAV